MATSWGLFYSNAFSQEISGLIVGLAIILICQEFFFQKVVKSKPLEFNLTKSIVCLEFLKRSIA
jgi:hypothetical protein